jgi:hypothetical protein
LREGGRYIFFLNGERMTTAQPLYFTVGRSYIDQEFVVFPRNSYNRIAKNEFKKTDRPEHPRRRTRRRRALTRRSIARFFFPL